MRPNARPVSAVRCRLLNLPLSHNFHKNRNPDLCIVCQHGIYRLVRAALQAGAALEGTCRSCSWAGFVYLKNKTAEGNMQVP